MNCTIVSVRQTKPLIEVCTRLPSSCRPSRHEILVFLGLNPDPSLLDVRADIVRSLHRIGGVEETFEVLQRGQHHGRTMWSHRASFRPCHRLVRCMTDLLERPRLADTTRDCGCSTQDRSTGGLPLSSAAPKGSYGSGYMGDYFGIVHTAGRRCAYFEYMEAALWLHCHTHMFCILKATVL